MREERLDPALLVTPLSSPFSSLSCHAPMIAQFVRFAIIEA